MKLSSKITTFKKRLLTWYAANKRDLPFRGEKNPYRIWVSEVLLQQTQMSRGVEYYRRFIKRFPTVRSLAQASWGEFLPYFRGLGFYTRGRNMLKAAKFVKEEYMGLFPDDFTKLTKIPGIGPYTANALLSFAYGRPVLTQDTNVNRIMARVFHGQSGNRDSGQRQAGLTNLTQKIERSLSTGRSADLNQAMMDLGSAVCLAKRPKCGECPLRSICSYAKESVVGSRQLVVKFHKRVAQPYDHKHPIALIHHEGKVLTLPTGRLPSGSLDKGDERAYLKALAQRELGLEISVRPPFLMWVKDGVRYSAHRCRVLSGVPSPDWPTREPDSLHFPEEISLLV